MQSTEIWVKINCLCWKYHLIHPRLSRIRMTHNVQEGLKAIFAADVHCPINWGIKWFFVLWKLVPSLVCTCCLIITFGNHRHSLCRIKVAPLTHQLFAPSMLQCKEMYYLTLCQRQGCFIISFRTISHLLRENISTQHQLLKDQITYPMAKSRKKCFVNDVVRPIDSRT